MPTKTEQADLLQVMFGRNGDSPIPIVAPATPAECFDFAIEAVAHRAQVHDPGRLPVGRVPRHRLRAVAHPRRRRPARHRASTNAVDGDGPFQPYERDPETLARPWAVPGTPGLEHRIGGLEKADITGNVSYDPDNHHRMQLLRAGQGRRHRQRHPAARGLRPVERRPADPRLGLHLRRHPLRGRAPAGRRARPSPTPTCATSTRSPPTPGGPAPLPPGAHPGGQPRPAAAC